MYIISACLTGQNCKYNGGNNACRAVMDFTKKQSYVLVCPEAGTLPTPRPPIEIRDGRAFHQDGKDVTAELREGAARALKTAETAARCVNEEIEGAVLKANSPSCGCGAIYDGTFQGRLVCGDGFFAKLLKGKGIEVITEKEVIK